MRCSQGYLRNHHPHISIHRGKLSGACDQLQSKMVSIGRPNPITTQRLVIQEVRRSRSQPIHVKIIRVQNSAKPSKDEGYDLSTKR